LILTQVFDEFRYVLKSRRIKFCTTVASLPVVIDFHCTFGESVVDDFLSKFSDRRRVDVDFVPRPCRPNRILYDVRIRNFRRHAEEIFNGPFVCHSSVFVLANLVQHRISGFSIRSFDFGCKAHLTRSRTVYIYKKGNRLVDIDIISVRVEEIRLDDLKQKKKFSYINL